MIVRYVAPLLAVLLVPLLTAATAVAQHGHGHAPAPDHGHDHGPDHGHDDGDDHIAEGAGLRALHGWTRATAGREALVFVELSNLSGGMVRLIGAESPVAEHAELVGFQLIDGREGHAPVGPVDLGPDEEIALAPFGLAIRLQGLKAPLVQGDTTPLTLLTADGALDLVIDVEAADATQHGHAGHNH